MRKSDFKDFVGKRVIINSDGTADIIEDKTKILVAIPTSTNMIYIDCIQSVYNMVIPDDIKVDIETFTGYGCAQARNKIGRRAIDGNYYAVLFVDSDQIVPSDVLIKLLKCDADISGGWTTMSVTSQDINVAMLDRSKNQYGEYVFFKKNNIPDNILEVDGIGYASTLIRTNVYRNLPYPWYKYVEYNDNDYSILSEDLFFAGNAKANGYKIVCDFSCSIGHQKTIVI